LIPKGSQPVAGGRRLGAAHRINFNCFLLPGGKPARGWGCDPFGIDHRSDPSGGLRFASPTGYWLRSLREQNAIPRTWRSMTLLRLLCSFPTSRRERCASKLGLEFPLLVPDLSSGTQCIQARLAASLHVSSFPTSRRERCASKLGLELHCASRASRCQAELGGTALPTRRRERGHQMPPFATHTHHFGAGSDRGNDRVNDMESITLSCDKAIQHLCRTRAGCRHGGLMRVFERFLAKLSFVKM
jgi:hypothetical protein